MIRGYSIIQNISTVASILSAIFFLPKMDSWGRKFCTIYFAPGVFLSGLLCWIIGFYLNSIEIALPGSICFGIAIPIKAAVLKLYIAECAPDAIRGFSVMSIIIVSIITATIFQFLALEQVLGTDSKWIILYIITAILTILYMSIGSLIPESPKYMKVKNKDEKKIINTIKLFHGESADPVTVIDKYEKEILLTKSSTYDIKKIFSDPTLFDSFKLVLIATLTPVLGLHRLLIANSILLKIRYGFSNADAVMFDSIFMVIFIPLSFLMPIIIEKLGRRPIVISSVFFNLVGLIIMLVTQTIFELLGSSLTTIVLSASFSIMYFSTQAMGVAIFDILLVADLLPVGSKSVVSKIILVLNNVMSIVSTLYFSFFDPILGVFVYFPFIFFQFFAFIYFWKHLPETKQKSVNENFEELRSRVNSYRTSRCPTLEISKPEYGTFN